MTTPDPAAIARGLSPAMRDALLGMNGSWQNLENIGPFVSGSTMTALLRRGLVSKAAKTRPRVSFYATTFGLAVRAELERMNDDR